MLKTKYYFVSAERISIISAISKNIAKEIYEKIINKPYDDCYTEEELKRTEIYKKLGKDKLKLGGKYD